MRAPGPLYQRLGTLLAVLVLGAPGALRAQVPDTVYLYSGERVVGHMARLQGGTLAVGTAEMGVVNVLWSKVSGVRSTKRWVVRTRQGQQRTGTLWPSPAAGTLRLATGPDTVALAMADIVDMLVLRNGFWPRIDGSLSVGFNHQRANSITQFVLGGTARYRGERGTWDMVLNNISTTSPELDASRKQDGLLLYERYLHRRWTSGVLVGGEANTQLQLAARWKAILMVGNRVLFRPHTTVLLLAGAQGNSERSREGATLNSLELLFAQVVRIKVPAAPKLELTMDLYETYGLTVPGRIRVLADAKLRYALFKNLQLGLDFYEQYDSEPLDGNEALNDYRLAGTLSLAF